MILIAILCTPLLVSGLFAGALFAIWRRRQGAVHAACWSAAFAAIAIGWLSVLGTTIALGAAPLPGAAPSLCWLAASLLLVHGLRYRSGRPDLKAPLAAIWTVIALAIGLLSDLAPAMGPLIPPTTALLMGVGLVLAAIAVGPRRSHQDRHFCWWALGLLLSFAAANLLLVLSLLTLRHNHDLAVGLAALAATVTYVGLGLATVLLLNQDFGIALERLARTDPLTGAWNRRGFDETAPKLLAKLRVERRDRASVAIADIDSFKAINDRFGHTTGDAVLVEFTRLLSTAVRPGDLFARLGGEEFALLAIGVDATELFQRIEHVRGMVALPSEQGAGLPPITASFGVAQINPHTLALRDALERADHALYQAKHQGRNRTILDDVPESETADEINGTAAH